MQGPQPLWTSWSQKRSGRREREISASNGDSGVGRFADCADLCVDDRTYQRRHCQHFARHRWLAAVFVPIWIYQKRLRLIVDETHVRIRRLGPDRKVPRSEIATVVMAVTREVSNNADALDRVALLLDGRGHTIGRLSQSQWGRDGLRNATQHLGVPVRNLSKQPRDLADLRKRYPGSFSWPRAHPFATGIIVSSLPIALIFILG